MTPTANPFEWMFFQLEHYLVGSKGLLGLFIIAAILFGLYMMRVSKMLLVVLMTPLVLALAYGGYLPQMAKVGVYVLIAVIWVIMILHAFFSKG
jgi:hypothetical protein